MFNDDAKLFGICEPKEHPTEPRQPTGLGSRLASPIQ